MTETTTADKTHRRFLPNNAIKPGCIYLDKKDIAYFYIGHGKDIIFSCGKNPEQARKNACPEILNPRNCYIRLDNSLICCYENSRSIMDFYKNLIEYFAPDGPLMSHWEAPRKFTKLISDRFADYQNELPRKSVVYDANNIFAYIETK